MSKEPPELVEPSALLFEPIATGFGYGHSVLTPSTDFLGAGVGRPGVRIQADTKRGPPLGGRPRFDASLADLPVRVKRSFEQIEVDFPALRVDSYDLHPDLVSKT